MSLQYPVASDLCSRPRHDRLRAALDKWEVLSALGAPEFRDLLEGVQPAGVSVDRVHFGSRLGIVIEYTVSPAGSADKALCLFGQIPDNDPSEAFATVRRKLRSRHPDGACADAAVALSRKLGMLFRKPGCDERIDGLCHLCTAPKASPSMLLAHRLGKRAVLRVTSAPPPATSPTAILKLYKRGATAGVLSAHAHTALQRQGFDGKGGFSVPGVRLGPESNSALWMDDMPGVSLASLSGPSRIAALGLTGAGLAMLHGSEIAGLEPYDASDEVALLRRWQSFVAPLAPAFAHDISMRIDELDQSRPFLSVSRNRPIHRDFHEKQVICHGTNIAFTDFDTVRTGNPAQDLGNFIAHLRFGALTSGSSSAAEEQVFLDGYAARQDLPSERDIAWHVSATCLRLALLFHFSDAAGDVAGRLISGA